MKFTGTKEELEKYIFEKKLSLIEIAKIYNVGHSCIGYWTKKFKIRVPSCGGRNIKDLTGKRFGRLLVVRKTKNLLGRGEAYWLCKCDCGNVVEIIGKSLRHKLTKSCGCLRKDLCYKGYRLLSGCYWHRILKGAKKRNIKVAINKKDAWKQFERQNQKCALTGVPIVLVRDYSREHSKHTASLDRIDNSKGYTKDNIQWVHREINYMKNKHSQDYFIEWCRKVVKYADSKIREKTINSPA